MKAALADFGAKHRYLLFAVLLMAVMLLTGMDRLAFVAVWGGLGIVYCVSRYLDDEHPLIDVYRVGALLLWAFFCWQGFEWIVKHESAKAQTFCGVILDYETRTYPRQRSVHLYLVENRQGETQSFAGHDYLGGKNSRVCVQYIPHGKSVFFSKDYVLGATKE